MTKYKMKIKHKTRHFKIWRNDKLTNLVQLKQMDDQNVLIVKNNVELHLITV